MEHSSPSSKAKRWIAQGIVAYLAILLITVAVLFAVAKRRGADVSPNLANGFTALLTQPAELAPFSGELVPPHAPTLGPADAPITIVEFGDFQCPYCRASVYPVRQLLRDYPNRIRLVFRQFPISSTHALAEPLALASLCAHDQGKFWSMHDAFYQNQDTLDRSAIDEIAKSVGLDMNRFDLCFSNRQFEAQMKEDFSAGIELGVRGTPTWIVNGQKLQGALPYETWKQLIESLAKAGKN